MTELLKASVPTLAEAKTGDTILVYDSQRARYIGGVYAGRGVWTEAKVTDENSRSVMFHRTKFDRKTGRQLSTGGYVGTMSAAGQLEYEAEIWMAKNKVQLVRSLEKTRNIAVLKNIAALLGFEEAE